MMRSARRWKRWVGGLAAAGLLGGCSSVPVYGNPVTEAPRQAPRQLFSVDWWTPLVGASLLEYAPREMATPAYDARNERIVVLNRDGYVRSVAPGGEVVWRFQAGNRFYAGATVHEGTVYVPGSDGFLYALDAKTGERKWKYQAGEALATSPVIAEGLVLVASQSDTLFAVRREAGELVWLYRRDPPTGFTIHRASAPAVRGSTAWVGFSDGTLVSLDLTDGSLRWEKSLAPSGGQFIDVDTTPVLDESGRLYAASYSGGVYALEAETGDVLWNSVAQGITSLLVRGDVVIAAGDDRLDAYLGDTGRLLWSKKLQERAGFEPVLVKGMLLVPAQRSLMFVDPRTGQARLAWDPGAGVSATPRVADSKVYVLSNNGYLYALRLGGGRSG